MNKLFAEKSITSHIERKWLNSLAMTIYSRLMRFADWLDVSPACVRIGEDWMYKSDLSHMPFSEEKNYALVFYKIKT